MGDPEAPVPSERVLLNEVESSSELLPQKWGNEDLLPLRQHLQQEEQRSPHYPEGRLEALTSVASLSESLPWWSDVWVQVTGT